MKYQYIRRKIVKITAGLMAFSIFVTAVPLNGLAKKAESTQSIQTVAEVSGQPENIQSSALPEIAAESEKKTEVLKDAQAVKKREKKKLDEKEILAELNREDSKKTKVIEVTDLHGFTAAVQLMSAQDDLTPAYTFQENSQKVIVHGNEEKLSAKTKGEGEDLIVPEEVFAEDAIVDTAAITDGDDVVTLETVAEVSDYEIITQENTVELVNPFQSRRLIVKSPKGFETHGAKSVIQGYDQLFVLEYETEEETKAAFDKLKLVSYLSVEPDAVIASATMEINDAEQMTSKSTVNSMAAQYHPVTVAVLDTGYDYQGNDTTRIKEGIDISGTGYVQDENGHGTQIANIIRENTNEKVSLLPICITDKNGRSSSLKVYLGIMAAMEQNAEIINVSMTSYKSASGFMVAEAVEKAYAKGCFVVTSAGNYGSDVINFTPANIQNAVVVSAVNKDGKVEKYSNFGATVDYSSYGAVKTTGLNAECVTITGTSVSAAVVTAYIGQIKSVLYNRSMEEIFAWLNANAKDAGESGWDAYYGNGIIDIEDLKISDETAGEEICDLLICDWKNLSDEELDTHIGYATNIQRRIFIDKLSTEELQELLARNTMFSRKIVYYEGTLSDDNELKNPVRMHDTLYSILMSKEVSDAYELQRNYDKIDSDFTSGGAYGNYLHIYHWGKKDVSCVKADTTQNTKDATIYCYLQKDGVAGDSYFDHKIYFSIDEGDSAFDFSNATPTTNATTDFTDSGNPNVLRLRFKNVKVSKPQGCVLNYSSSMWNKSGTVDNKSFAAKYYYVYKYQVKDSNGATKQGYYADGRWHGGFWDLGNASGDNCKSKTITTSLDIGTRDMNEDQAGITYRLPLKEHAYLVSESNVTDVAATCSQAGSYHVQKNFECPECDKKWEKDGNSIAIPQLAHAYGLDWKYYTDASGVASGLRLHECVRSEAECGRGTDVNGKAWQVDVQYLQRIGYRLMDVYGKYPKDYTYAVNDYYALGTSIPACGTAETIGAEYMAPANAVAAYQVGGTKVVYMDIPRKPFTVTYETSMEGVKNMPKPDTVSPGSMYEVTDTVPTLTGYNLTGWTLDKEGKGAMYAAGKSMTVTSNIILYAQWEKAVYTITLDSQGADEKTSGEDAVYQKYGTGYYEDNKATQKFADNKIDIPVKYIEDSTVLNKTRKQHFLGYYTKKNGKGYQMVKPDGSLIANINNAGDYKFFTADSTVYANWENMYAIQFSDNLTDEDMAILSKDENGNSISDPVINPATQWKEKGKDITVSYETVTIHNTIFKDIYRLKGWSLTPTITSDDEIVLSETKNTYTFTANEDVILYAQWDTSFMVTYVGNEQSEGVDYMDEVENVTDSYTFNPNDKEKVVLLPNDTADYFVKKVEKPTIDIATGNAKDENGNPYMETVECSFRGWSMFADKREQVEEKIYSVHLGYVKNEDIMRYAAYVAKVKSGKGVTFESPVDDYGTFNAPHLDTRNLIAGENGYGAEVTMEENVRGYLEKKGKIFVNMYAVWDEFPQIAASNLYFSLADAQSGLLTEEYLLDKAMATDEELKSHMNPKGKLAHGADAMKNTEFTILDYQSSDFTGAETDMAMTITYCAKDAAGNVTTKMVTVHLVDTKGEEYDNGSVRFISAEYIDTLSEDSIWRTDEYATKLTEVLSNGKTGEEYTEVTQMQQAFGVENVKKPGSGTWNHLEQVWQFSHEDVLAVQSHIDANGMFGNQEVFLSSFGHCRVQ